MGGIRERYVRDKKYLSHSELPLYKGVSEDDVRDGAISAAKRIAYVRMLTIRKRQPLKRLSSTTKLGSQSSLGTLRSDYVPYKES